MTALVIPRRSEPSLRSRYARNAAESASPSLWRGLRGAWVPALGNTGGVLRDLTAYGSHSTSFISLDPATDWITQAGHLGLDFDGSDDYAIIGQPAALNGLDPPLSMFVAAAPNSLGEFDAGAVGICTEAGNSGFVRTQFLASNRLQVQVDFDTTDITARTANEFVAAPDGSYHTYGWTWPGTTAATDVTFYTDLASVAGLAISNGAGNYVSTLTDDLHIGSFAFGGNAFEGPVFAVLLWTRMVTPQEFAQLYADPLAPFRLRPLVVSIPAAAPAATTTAAIVKRHAPPSLKSGFARNAAESASPSLWRGLVGAWCPALGQTGDTLRDVSGHELHGTLTGMDPATDWSVRDKGISLDFDGTIENVSIGDPTAVDFGSGDFSLCCVFRTTASDRQLLIGKDEAGQRQFGLTYDFFNDAADRLGIFYYVGASQVVGTSGVSLITDTKFHSLVGQREEGVLSLFLDGVPLSTSQSGTPGTMSATSSTLMLGGRGYSGFTDNLTGSILTAKIYNRALTPVEIRQLHADPLAPFRLRPLVVSIPAAAPAPTMLPAQRVMMVM